MRMMALPLLALTGAASSEAAAQLLSRAARRGASGPARGLPRRGDPAALLLGGAPDRRGGGPLADHPLRAAERLGDLLPTGKVWT